MPVNIVKLKEKYGNTINVAQINFKGETLYGPIPFASLNNFIANIGEFKERPDDIWINSYYKSGISNN